MTPNAIYSKSGKGVQEASGKTSILSRGDRAVLSAFDGRVTVGGVAEKVGKPFDAKFEQLVTQLEKDGFIREVSSGAPVASASAPVRPAAARPAARPAATGGGEELDFTIASPAPKAAPGVDLAAKARAEAERKAKEEEAHSYKARQEAEARAKAEAEARAKAANQARLQAEAAAKAKAESEARARAEAEAKAKAAEADKVRAEAEAKVKAAQQAALRLASEAKAKAEAEMQHKLEAERAKAREEAERIRKETEEKARKEAEELRQRLEAERKAREEAERKAKEAEERRRKDDEERRAREEAERKAREAAERKAKEDAERKGKEEAERKAREEGERKAKEEAERKAKEQAERRAKEEREENERRAKEEAERRARDEKERGEREAREARERAQEEEAAAKRRAESEKPHEEKAGKPADSFADSLLADLDSFDKRDEEEQKTKAEAERKAKEEKARRRKEEEERRAKEEAELEAKEEAERKAKAEAKRREKERVEREEREAQERAEREAEERKRKARESLSAKAQDAAADKAGAGADDIGISDEDLDLDDVKRDEQALSKESRRAARERERQRERDKEREPDGRGDQEPAARVEAAAAPAKFRRPVKWGKPLALGLFGLLAAAIAVLHIMPISTGEYESAASEALGVPVKIGSANLSLVTGVQVKMENVTVGAAKIARLRAYPEVGSLFGPRKAFSRIEIDGATLPQQSIGAALYGKVKAANFEVGRISAQKVKLDGPLALPLLDADLQLGAGGELRTLTLRGPDSLLARVVPAGSDLEFELNAATFTVPMASEISFSQFGMKGTANREGMDIAAWTASLYDGVLNGNAKIDWRDRWTVDGVVTARGVNAAVFAPALLSEGKAEGTGKFSMSGADPGKVASAARMEGTFTINKGVLGSIDISRALSTGGRQGSGRTPFSELAGQGLYDKGNVSFRNVTISAGALNAGASADIAAGGALSGRIVADVRTPSQTLRATLAIGGTVKEPQVRN